MKTREKECRAQKGQKDEEAIGSVDGWRRRVASVHFVAETKDFEVGVGNLIDLLHRHRRLLISATPASVFGVNWHHGNSSFDVLETSPSVRHLSIFPLYDFHAFRTLHVTYLSLK